MRSIGANYRCQLLAAVIDPVKLLHAARQLGVDEDTLQSWIVFAEQPPHWVIAHLEKEEK